jgi:hypothetical protein
LQNAFNLAFTEGVVINAYVINGIIKKTRLIRHSTHAGITRFL